MSGYRVRCPLCQTQIRGPHGGAYREFARAVKALKVHWRISCSSPREMGRRERDVVAESAVEPIE
jgi:hypothetical protein